MKNHGDGIDLQQRSKFIGHPGCNHTTAYDCTPTITLDVKDAMPQKCQTQIQEALQTEFDNIEESLRDMLRNNAPSSGFTKEDTQVQMVHYKNAISQCRNHIQVMEQENQSLKQHIAQLTLQATVPSVTSHKSGNQNSTLKNTPQPPTPTQLEDVVMQCTALSDRIKKMEEHNSMLLVEAEKQKCQYERCLDKVASQVVQALLTQRRLQTECCLLRSQVRRLAIQNSSEDAASPVSINGYDGYEMDDPSSYPEAGLPDISQFLNDLTSSLHSAGFSKYALTETLSNCPTLPMRESRLSSPQPPKHLTPPPNHIATSPNYLSPPPNHITSSHGHITPSQGQTNFSQSHMRSPTGHTPPPHLYHHAFVVGSPIPEHTFIGKAGNTQNAYVNTRHYTPRYQSESPPYQNIELSRSPPPPLQVIPETTEPRAHGNQRLWRSGSESIIPTKKSETKFDSKSQRKEPQVDYEESNFYNDNQTTQYPPEDCQKERKRVQRSHSFDNHSYVQCTPLKYNGHTEDTKQKLSYEKNERKQEACFRRSLENLVNNSNINDINGHAAVHSNTQFPNTQCYSHNLTQNQSRYRNHYISLPNDTNSNNNNVLFNQSCPSFERGRSRHPSSRSRHLSPPQVKTRERHSTLSPPTHRRSRSQDVINYREQCGRQEVSSLNRTPSVERKRRIDNTSKDNLKQTNEVWMSRSKSSESQSNVSKPLSSPKSPNIPRKKSPVSPTYKNIDLPPPPPPPPEETCPSSPPTSPISPRLPLSVWKTSPPNGSESPPTLPPKKSAIVNDNYKVTKEGTMERNECPPVTYVPETTFGADNNDIKTNTTPVASPEIIRKSIPSKLEKKEKLSALVPPKTKSPGSYLATPRSHMLKKCSKSESSLLKPPNQLEDKKLEISASNTQIDTTKNGLKPPAVIATNQQQIKNATSCDLISSPKLEAAPPLENRRASEGASSGLDRNRPSSRKSKLAAPSQKNRLTRDRSKSERIRTKSSIKQNTQDTSLDTSPNATKPTSKDNQIKSSESNQSSNKDVKYIPVQSKKPLTRSISGGPSIMYQKNYQANVYETSLMDKVNTQISNNESTNSKVQVTNNEKPTIASKSSSKLGKDGGKKKVGHQKSLVGLMKAKFGKSSGNTSNQSKKNGDKNLQAFSAKPEISSPIDFRTLSLEPNTQPPSSQINQNKKNSKQNSIEEQQGQIGKKLSQPLANSPLKAIQDSTSSNLEDEDSIRVHNFMNRQNSKRNRSGLRYKGRLNSEEEGLGRVELIPVGNRALGNNSLEVMMRNVDENRKASGEETKRYSYSDSLDSIKTPGGIPMKFSVEVAKQKSASLDKDKVVRRQNAFENVVVNKEAMTKNSKLRLSNHKRRSRHEYENVVMVPAGKPPLPEDIAKNKLGKIWKSMSSSSLSKESQSSGGSRNSLNQIGGNGRVGFQQNQQKSFENALISSIVQAELDQAPATEPKDAHQKDLSDDSPITNQTESGKSSMTFSTTGSSKSGTSFDSWPSSCDDNKMVSGSFEDNSLQNQNIHSKKNLDGKQQSKIPSGSRSSLGSFGYGSGTSNSSSSSNGSFQGRHSHSTNNIASDQQTAIAPAQIPQSVTQQGKFAARKSLSPMRSVSQESKLKDTRLSRPSGGIPTNRMRMGVRSIGGDASSGPIKYNRSTSGPGKIGGNFGFSGTKTLSGSAPQKLAPLSYGIPKPTNNKNVSYSNASYAPLGNNNNNIPKRYAPQRTEAF